METTCNQEVQEQAILFHKPKTDYHIKLNEAAKSICGSQPHLVRKGYRGKLLDLARRKVAEQGYSFKKGYSRSKVYGDGTPKRPKLDKDMRRQRMDELQEDIEDSSRRISLKEKRVVQAETRDYKLCDELTEQISEVK